MTEMTVISAATPTQMPSMETQLMKETKKPRLRLHDVAQPDVDGQGMEHKAGKATADAARKCELRQQMRVPRLVLM